MTPDMYNTEDSGCHGEFVFDFENQDLVSATDDEHDIEEKLFNMNPLDQFASDTGLFPQVQAPLPLRPYRTFTKSSDRSSPTISGSELLNLEGRPSPEPQMTAASLSVSAPPSSASAAPTLRDKGKFGPSTQNAPRDNRAPKVPSKDSNKCGFQPPELPMSPSSYEWTQKFEQQISLQTNRAELLNSQTQNFQDVQRESTKQTNGHMSPRERLQHRKAYSEQSALGSSYSHMIDYSQQISHSIPRDMNVQIPTLPSQTSNGYELSSQQSQQPSTSEGAFQHHRQAQSWGQTPAGFTSDYTVLPSQIQPDWLNDLHDDSTSYFANVSSQAEPAIFSQEDLTANCYAPPLPRNQQSSFSDLPTDDVLLNNLTNRRPHTPPPSNPSASPPTSEVTPSPQKQTRASRRQNNNALHLPKSNTALKPAKSLSTLKSPKSAGHLRGKKSVGGGLNHHHGGSSTKSPIKKESQQGMNFGFMNLTSEDKQKILTGVAPSGSSKTKARRELEANEEKRRMSLAAIKAIEVVGGDSQALKQQLQVEGEIEVDGMALVA